MIEFLPQSTWPIRFGYVNWRGESGQRVAVPIRTFFGATEHHPEPQWLMEAYDVDKEASRIFAMKDMTDVVLAQPAT